MRKPINTNILTARSNSPLAVSRRSRRVSHPPCAFSPPFCAVKRVAVGDRRLQTPALSCGKSPRGSEAVGDRRLLSPALSKVQSLTADAVSPKAVAFNPAVFAALSKAGAFRSCAARKSLTALSVSSEEESLRSTRRARGSRRRPSPSKSLMLPRSGRGCRSRRRGR